MRDILFPGNPNCPVASFESYISKLNPKCEAIWQRPKDFVYEGDNVGKHLLGLMMTNIAKGANCQDIILTTLFERQV